MYVLSTLSILTFIHPDSPSDGWIFLACDILSLVLQGLGGGLASSAKDHAGSLLGSNIMIGGIAVQVAMMTTFCILVAEFVHRLVNDKPLRKPTTLGPGLQLSMSSDSTIYNPRALFDSRRKLLLSALLFTTLLLFIRAIYRLVELGSGWDSDVMTTEWLFNVFDAALVTVAFYVWNVAHPGKLLAVPNDAKSHYMMQSRTSVTSITLENPLSHDHWSMHAPFLPSVKTS
ncbi:envelope glycoprotein [Paramarasmius palmivorus]|uniref:Envelope glycoprotein n=1 Tax=Paramarasmius palmivorus TaxID=297713 RepID=A0AAW0CU13_9AGAR